MSVKPNNKSGILLLILFFVFVILLIIGSSTSQNVSSNNTEEILQANNKVQDANKSDKKVEVVQKEKTQKTTSLFSEDIPNPEYDKGYKWGVDNYILDTDKCNIRNSDFEDGCINAVLEENSVDNGICEDWEYGEYTENGQVLPDCVVEQPEQEELYYYK